MCLGRDSFQSSGDKRGDGKLYLAMVRMADSVLHIFYQDSSQGKTEWSLQTDK